MTETKNFGADLCVEIRAVRSRFDGLPRGQIASLRRSRTADEIALEGTYWKIGGSLAQREPHLSHVVLLFPLARHVDQDHFSFGRFLARQLGDTDGAALRFRRLLDSRDRDDLDHRMRAILRLACSDKAPIDWGTVGRDVLWFFAESGTVRRRWAQEFYAPAPLRSEPPFTTTVCAKD